jgi:hypothetical protein
VSGAGDPLAGLPRPPGSPGVASGAARKYTAAATQLDASAQRVLKAVNGVVGSEWLGQGAASASRCTVALAAVYSQAAQAAHSSGASLTAFGTALTQAQSLWDRARTMADQAMSDESSYRSNAETQAQQLDKQAATGNIGAAHAAASVREDAASYSSPLRSRAVAMATQARQDAQTAASTAAGRLGTATSSMAAVPPAPSPTKGGEGGGEGDNLFKWFNDMVLGATNTGAAALTLPSTLFGAAKWGLAARSAARLPADLHALWDAEVNPLALDADRGIQSWAAVAAKADNVLGASTLFQQSADDELAAGKASFLRGGLPDSPIFEVGGKVLGGVAIVGDVGTLIDPGGNSVAEDTANRGAAVANGVSTVIVLNAATDEIPVAGEVVMVGSGLYLGGDWLYNHWSPFHNGMDAAGNGIKDGFDWTTHAAGTVLDDLNPFS